MLFIESLQLRLRNYRAVALPESGRRKKTVSMGSMGIMLSFSELFQLNVNSDIYHISTSVISLCIPDQKRIFLRIAASIYREYLRISRTSSDVQESFAMIQKDVSFLDSMKVEPNAYHLFKNSFSNFISVLIHRVFFILMISKNFKYSSSYHYGCTLPY